ncbi:MULTISPECIES: HAD family hydrolase [unclassified Streptomyces]|uniref:HAD family hydrolase n=1 Tax=unclassified Streptomyces TaxID=2593676 RepID=UPI000DB907B8|nr:MULTISPECIES: HAD family hydrolase [unclassified Streptomyces]MYT73615.1 HAD hydrolase-like protein [Streptomyces sp. SID8367]
MCTAAPGQLDVFAHRFACYQLDEAMGDWRPYDEVISRAFERACASAGIEFRPDGSNAATDQAVQNVARLGAAFHAVFTAEMSGAYKPRLQAFEFAYEQLGCRPEETMHISSSPRYDLQSATDLGVRDTVYLNRGTEPSAPFYHAHEVTSLTEVVDLLGL